MTETGERGKAGAGSDVRDEHLDCTGQRPELTESTAGVRRRFWPTASAGLMAVGGSAIVAAFALNAGAKAETWSAIAAWLTLLVALGAALVTVHQVVEGRRQRAEDDAAAHDRLRQQAKQAWDLHGSQLEAQRELAEQAAQPYVVVFAEAKVMASGNYAELVVRNVGKTPAYDVRLTFDQTVMSELDRSETHPLRIPDRFPVLAPGQEWRTLWADLRRELDDDSAWPPLTTAVADFRRAGGLAPIGGPFEYQLDLRSLVHGHIVEVRGSRRRESSARD